MRRAWALLPAAAALLAAGCSDYKGRTSVARGAFYAGQYERSAELYRGAAAGQEKERLLYLLDEGLALHTAGRYEESNRLLLEADRLIEDLNFAHLGAQTASVVFDDRSVPYQGEEFEDVLVNAFAAMNFLLAGGDHAGEEARIECRRLDWKLRLFNDLRGRKYLQNAFARYLSGVAYEMDGRLDDAYIDYKLVHQLRPDFEPVRRELVRLAHRLGFEEDAARWEKEFGIRDKPQAEAGTGEVVLVYECGRAPEKMPHDDLLDLPEYASHRFVEHRAQMREGGRRLADSFVLEDIEATARKTLEDRLGGIVAKRLLSLGLKAGVAYGARMAVRKGTGNSALADVAGLALFALWKSADEADTRSWLTLPANLQVARARLPAGTHSLEVVFQDPAGKPAGHAAAVRNVVVTEGGITLLVVRSIR